MNLLLTTEEQELIDGIFDSIIEYNSKNPTTTTSLISAGLFDTSNTTLMHSMFQGCTSLTTIDLQGWNTDNIPSLRNRYEDQRDIPL